MEPCILDAREEDFWRAVYVAAVGQGNSAPWAVADDAVRKLRRRQRDGIDG